MFQLNIFTGFNTVINFNGYTVLNIPGLACSGLDKSRSTLLF